MKTFITTNTFLFISIIITISKATTIEIDSWVVGPTYEEQHVNVGDTLIFSWAGFHNVYIHPTDTCNTTGAVLVGKTSGTSYTFTESDDGETITFSCDVGLHCDSGQIVKYYVSSNGDKDHEDNGNHVSSNGDKDHGMESGSRNGRIQWLSMSMCMGIMMLMLI